MEIKLTVNGKEVTVGIEFARNIVSDIPDGKEYYGVLHEFALSKVAAIRAEVAYKRCMSQETVKLLLQDRNIEVLSRIVTSECAKEYITDKDIDHIIATNSEDAIENIISYMDDYENINQVQTIEKIMKLENEYLLLKLADNWNTPKSVLKKLKDHKDPDVSKAARKSLDDC